MRKTTSIIVVILLVVFAFLYFTHEDSSKVVEPAHSEEVSFLKVPEGFKISYFAKDVPGARVIELDPEGKLLVSETSEGKVVKLDENQKPVTVLSGLGKPHGLAMSCRNVGGACYLYVATQGELDRFEYNTNAPLGPKERLLNFNSSSLDRHFTRSLAWLPDGDTLLISIGSSCDVCHEKETDYATVLYYNVKTKAHGVYAKGLRNATFMTLNPVNGKVFATEMGRDGLGDNLPPDEINIIEQKNNEPKNYGWPVCYGKNIHDDQFDKNVYIRNPCMEPFEVPSFIDLPAHSAPLGLAFMPEDPPRLAGEAGGWPEAWWYNLLVAYHGSWNRSEPTGYKIVRLKMNAKGEYQGTEDFITGWTTDGKLGRPVDIKVFPGGTAYISDDTAGVIYKLTKE